MNKIKFETFKVVVENMSKQYQMELDLSQYINPETLFDNLSIALDRLLDEFYTDIALDTILYPYIYENNRTSIHVDGKDIPVTNIEELYSAMELFGKVT